jgi:ankyrin repeat protein
MGYSKGQTVTWESQSSGYKYRKTGTIEAGSDINAADRDGDTALIRASWNGNTEIVELLIAAACDINAANIEGNTALIWASLNGHTRAGRSEKCKDVEV